MKNRVSIILVLLQLVLIFSAFQSVGYAAQNDGNDLTSSLWARAVLEVPGNPVTLVWNMVGADITPSGDQVISGYFYADPNDFAYGSLYNPELFVKIYIATNGWCNIAFNHVTVDPVTVYSAHDYVGTAQQTGSVTLGNRLLEHKYNGIAIDYNIIVDNNCDCINTEYDEVLIIGNADFIEQTQKALAVLQNNAPDAFEKVQKYIGIIEQGLHSGMWAYEDPPRFEVNDVTAFYSITWYAGAIAHDATHSELYHEYQGRYGTPVPYDIWAGVDAENDTIIYQSHVLELINAPQYEIDSINSLDGTHCDVDDDGDCDWDDYYGRNW